MSHMAAFPSHHRARVNGMFLGQYHGKQVTLLGSIVKADGGSSVQLKSSDGVLINVRIKTPLTEPLLGIMEVCGIGQGKNLILADSYVHFNEQLLKSFDMTSYNEMIGLINSMEGAENPWKP